MSEPGQKPPSASPVTALVDLARGSDKWVQMGTIAVVLLSGGGNFLTTWKSSEETQKISRDEREDLLRAVKEVHDVHEIMDETVRRQKEMDGNIKQILGNQNK